MSSEVVIPGFISIFYSIGMKPLKLWKQKVRHGVIRRIIDEDIQSLIVEIDGSAPNNAYISCPAEIDKSLNIRLPFLVMVLKNMDKHFIFDVQIIDDENIRRRFRASNAQSELDLRPFLCVMPLYLQEGWNQIMFDLKDYVYRAYGTVYIQTLRIQIYATCRIRRIYFCDRPYADNELPPEFKLFQPRD